MSELGSPVPLPNDLKRDLQRVLLPIMVTGEGGLLRPIGTGFVIGAFGRQALMMSAAHNFDEIRALDRPWQRHHPTSLFYVEEMDAVLRTTHMWASYRADQRRAFLARIEKVWISNPLDIALASIVLSDDVPQDVQFGVRLGIDTRPPAVGERIAALGYSGMQADELGSSTDYPYSYRVAQKLESREGRIAEVFATASPTGQPWPSFRCDVPFDSGMSGGPVVRLSGEEPLVCGLIHADESIDGDDMGRGSGRNAVAAMLWPSVITPVDVEMDGTEERLSSLLDLIRKGLVDDRGAAHDHVQIVRNVDGQTTGVGWH